jgi:hypothetical protein
LRRLHGALYSNGPLWTVVAPYSPVTALAIAVAVLLAILACARRLTPPRALAALLVVVPVLGAWTASLVLVGYRPRYAVAALPLAAIWCASAMRTRFRPLAGLLLIGLASLQLAALRRMDDIAYAREDTRAAAAYVSARDPVATVILVGDAANAFDRYASAASHLVTITPHEANDDAALRARVDPALTGQHEVWLLSARPWTTDVHDRVRALLDARYTPREEVTFAGVALRRYVDPSLFTVSMGPPARSLP